MKDRFDLEQHIMECWNVTSDVDMLLEAILDSPRFSDMPAEYADRISNMLLGMKELYEMRFERLWSTFEDCITTEFSPATDSVMDAHDTLVSGTAIIERQSGENMEAAISRSKLYYDEGGDVPLMEADNAL